MRAGHGTGIRLGSRHPSADGGHGSAHAGPNTDDTRVHPAPDARQEVLIAESLVPVTFETDENCRVQASRWWAPHLGHHLGNPGHIYVDHHVPLKNAHDCGGWA